MKNSKKFIALISAVWILILFYQNVQAQQNLAQEAYAIFEQSCLICHGENGAYRESLIIEHTALIEGGAVIPGNPEDSVFYQRLIETDIAKRMPLGQPPLAPEAIETIHQWIAAGAPDWDAIPKPKPDFITNDTLLETIENHVNSLSPRDKSFARYFTLTHLYNAGETTEALNAYRRALSKLINSLSWGRKVVKPQPIDAEQTLFYIDFRDYEWDVRNDAWTQIEQTYPYKITFDAPTQAHLREKLTTLQQEMNCEVPFINVDWFLATASLPPLYHDILALPETDRELEASLEVFVAENLLNAPGKRVWRAGFNNSRVSRHNRVVERHISRYGAYWKSYDFAGSAESQNIFTHPLDFTHDGGEIIFNLPNGLQAYYLADGDGNRLNEAPISIVSNPAVGDPTVRNGLSCIGCHTKGMQTFEDEVRAVVEQIENPPFNKDRALDLYVEKTVMDELVEEDTQRYRDALEAAGGVFGGIEPVQRLHEAFQTPLSAAHAAAAVGLETDVFLEKISKSPTLQNLLGTLVLENGTVKRDAWTSDFHDVVSGINSPDTVPPPVVERPEIIPGAGVHIPDPNLRATLNRILDKPSDAPITIEEMESFNGFGFHGTRLHSPIGPWIEGRNLHYAGIQDLTGLNYAINLQSLSLAGNDITDLTPIMKLPNLVMLDIGNNDKISDLSQIAKLPNLKELYIANNDKISDLTPMIGLKKLEVFVFENCPEITSLSALKGLTELKHIQAGHNFKISDLSPLAGKEKFKSILLWGPPISDLSPLANLPNIENINMCGNEISVIPSFENAPKLKTLYIFNNNVSDVSTLQNLKGLERLNLRDNKITDITPLSGLTNLKWLDLTANPITDFSPLAELSQNTNIIAGSVNIPDRNLRAAIAEALGKDGTGVIPITFEEMATLTQLRASDRDIKDLTGLEFAINLEEMWIGHNPVSDLAPLAGLKNFIGLHAWETRISDLSPLSGLTKLRWLDFGRTPTDGNRKLIGSLDLTPLAEITSLKKLTFYACGIQDISSLAGLTDLITLDISNNSVTDLSPIAGLINLENLGVRHSGISDITPLAALTKLKNLDFRANNISDVSPLAGLVNLEFLNLYGNSISDISPLEGLSVFPMNTWWVGNPGSAYPGPTIEGPWLWLNLSAKHFDTDWLAVASGGTVTEQQVATYGAAEGTLVGDSMWKTSRIDPNSYNINRLLDSFGGEYRTRKYNGIYGFIVLNSPQEQKTIMLQGKSTGNSIKIWINGELVHKDIETIGDGHRYDRFFPVTLKEGTNILLVASQNTNNFRAWTGFFAFEEGTEYTVLNTSDIAIPDPNLRAVIVETLGKEDTVPITFQEMATLTTLRASNKDIKDLTGLEHAINLEELWISENPISDLSPLSGLKNFIGLHAWDTDITDLSPLAEMSKLRWLDFGRTPISDLSPLADISSLRKLTVYAGSNLNDISPLAELTGLTFLNLGGNRISDISPVAGLINLESLIVYHGGALTSDLSALAGLTKLKHLNLRDKRTISDLSPLSGLTELTSLILFGNIISDLSPLSTLINLEELDLSENLISDISPLAVLTNLVSLNLAKNSISDISPLLELGNIKSLNLNDNLITDTSPLEKWFSKDTYIKFLRNPGVPKDGPNILGPWLWMLVRDRHLDSTTDLLAEASNGSVTEDQIAVNGATPGTFVGDIQWTTHNISTTGKQNLLDVLRDLGQSNYSNYAEIHNNVLYGSMVLYSPREQQTTIFVGTDGHHKIWLNGEYVHNDLGFQRSYFLDYDMFFSVTLKQGINMLLVAIDGGYWFNCFLGFAEGTEYTVVPPDVRLTFSTSETNLLTGDTFTLNLNAENITDLAGWQTDIVFDPNVLEAVEVTEGDFLKSEGSATFFQGGTIDNTGGKIKGMFAARQSEGGVSGTGTLLSVTFMAKAGAETQITLENFEFGASDGTIIPTVPPNITITVGEYPAWDVNQDGRGSILDLILVAQDLGSGAPANLRTDVNRDGVINVQDLIIVSQHIGESTDSAASPVLAMDNKEFTLIMVQAWIDQAQAANDGSLAFRQGIENLQKLLASMLPEKTTLLANYPNPFNPETWIPYHLAKPANVTLTIYAANGAIVRTLALGHQAAGIYQSRSRAAHWDGKNSVGESVASGVYFYTLTAGDFTATRKMLILK
ncbi:hypothetical protein C6501_11375 [Candidatus Poribacteria bacterium]|nr:MAG: hypothetical protein C6501_11375 [Candidatus Poribacteria bacterium]